MNPKCEASRSNVEDPFKDLKIGNWSILDNIDQRSLCPICKKSRKYFCYTCYVPVESLQGYVPKIKLPIKIDIIKHSREIDGKSTAAHAAVLAPDDVRIYTYPCVPDYGTDEKIIVVYPGKNAMSIKEFVTFCCSEDHIDSRGEPSSKRRNMGPVLPVTRAIFIDSTWNQSRGIYKDERLQALPCVVLQTRISQFWRHQNGSPRWYLATIEALHQFLVELHEALADTYQHSRVCAVGTSELNSNTRTEVCDTRDLEGIGGDVGDRMDKEKCANDIERQDITSVTQPDFSVLYQGQYDNLLFFFRYMYSKIHSLYDHEDLRAYKRPLK